MQEERGPNPPPFQNRNIAEKRRITALCIEPKCETIIIYKYNILVLVSLTFSVCVCVCVCKCGFASRIYLSEKVAYHYSIALYSVIKVLQWQFFEIQNRAVTFLSQLYPRCHIRHPLDDKPQW